MNLCMYALTGTLQEGLAFVTLPALLCERLCDVACLAKSCLDTDSQAFRGRGGVTVSCRDG